MTTATKTETITEKYGTLEEAEARQDELRWTYDGKTIRTTSVCDHRTAWHRANGTFAEDGYFVEIAVAVE